MELVSGVIGVANALLCLVQKVPQIVSLLKSKSSRGISLPSIVLEFWCYSSTVCYSIGSSLSFSSYCEYPALVIQDFILLGFVLHDRRLLGLKSTSIFLLFAAFQISLANGALSVGIMNIVVSVAIPISATSKTLQLFQILRDKDSGEVSGASWAIGTITSLARVYTFTVDEWNVPLALNNLISTALNFSVCAAAAIYRKNNKSKEK